MIQITKERYLNNSPLLLIIKRILNFKFSINLGLLLIPSLCFANNISLSTQRIYLDQKNASTNFVIKNRESVLQECSLGTTYFKFAEDGSMSPNNNVILPDNAAEKITRFSPRHFKIEPNARQTIRFRLRRKRDTLALEHRSYITVRCSSPQVISNVSVDGEVASIPLRPQLQQNIPLIVRPQKLSVNLWFSDVSLTDNKLSLVLHREGTKSVYGKVTLMDKNSGNTLSQSANFAIYHETKAKSLYMTVPEGMSLEHLKIEFNEAKEEGDVAATWQASSAGE